MFYRVDRFKGFVLFIFNHKFESRLNTYPKLENLKVIFVICLCEIRSILKFTNSN